jgi:hypothetical protein
MEEETNLTLTKMKVESSPRLSERRFSFQKENSHRRRANTGISQAFESYKDSIKQREVREHEGRLVCS